MKKQGVFLREIKAGSTDATIDICGVIGWEVAFIEMKAIIAAIPANVKRVLFDIYSPGGDVWDGNGIVQVIGELGKTHETVARVQVAASMATLIAVACNKRTMASNGRFLIHNAWTQTSGDAAQHEKAAKELRDCEQEAAKFYAERTGKTAEAMLALMGEERWLTPQETKDFGFVQEIDDPFNPDDVANVKAEIMAAGKWPQALVEIPKQEDAQNENDASDGAKPDEADKPDEPEQPAIDPGLEEMLGKAIERGRIEGIAIGKADASRELQEGIAALENKLKVSEKAERKLQSERDSLAARYAALEKSCDEQVKVLTAKLGEVTARNQKFLSGALAFSPDVQTWEEALRACSGSYELAAKKYPELRAAFVKKNSK